MSQPLTRDAMEQDSAKKKAVVVTERKDSAGGRLCKKMMKFLFSHIGLCGMVVAYAVAGGFIFMHLEQTNEKQECVNARNDYLPTENETMHKLWDVCKQFTSDDDMVNFMKEFQEILRSFRNNSAGLSWNTKDDCELMGEENGPAYAWSLSGSILFSVTVFTTIGYGHIAPKTFWGRLVCIAYAVLGIPLMLLCLSNIGDAMANVFRFTYTKVCCCECRKKPRKQVVAKVKSEKRLAEEDDHCLSNETLAISTITVPPNGEDSLEVWKAQFEAAQLNSRKHGKVKDAPKKDELKLVEENEEENEEEVDSSNVSVPFTITLSVIGAYIFLGAILFSVWEGWDWLKAAYYCFITIATIGFGDVVPGIGNLNTIGGQLQMLGATFYMLFGMAIISMCFNLIQEEIVGKFHWIADKIGVAQKSDDGSVDGDDDNDDEYDDIIVTSVSTADNDVRSAENVAAAAALSIDDALIRRRIIDETGKNKREATMT